MESYQGAIRFLSAYNIIYIAGLTPNGKENSNIRIEGDGKMSIGENERVATTKPFSKAKLALVAGSLILVALLVLVFSTLDRNDAGYYTVVQSVTGRMWVKNTPGYYLKWFGRTTRYRIADTLYFSKWPDEGKKGNTSIDVRFTDGGKGEISMNVRYRLPAEQEKILLIHETFGNDQAFKLGAIEQLAMQAVQLTASMMTAEDSYRNRRPQFISMIMDQITEGLYETHTTTTRYEGETITLQEIIREESGQAVRKRRDLEEHGVLIMQVNVTEIDYEDDVLRQIARKRESSMEAELAKVEAELARQANIQAEEEGKRNVTIARYKEEETRAQEVTRAEKEKEVAELAAQRALAVAEIERKKAQVLVETAELVRKATILEAEGQSEAKRLVLEADGALAQKLETLVAINQVWAQAYTSQRPTPDVVIGGTGEGTGVTAQTFMDLLTVRAIQDLSLDLGVK